jgi:hypothetical protein
MRKDFYNPISISNRKQGKKYETIVLSLIRPFFNATFYNNENRNKWEKIDFIDEEDKLCIENKSRNILHNQYDTIMISYHKYIASRELMEKGYKAFFSFYFVEEKKLMLYEIKDKLEYDIEIKKGGTNKRGIDDYNDCLYIPIKYLIDTDKYISYQDYKEKNNGLTYL